MPQDQQVVESPDAINVNAAAQQINGLLGDDGHYNPNPDQVSRGHPDYDPDADERNDQSDRQGRDDKGRFRKKASDEQDSDSDEQNQQNLDAENDSDAGNDTDDAEDAQDRAASDDADDTADENDGEPIQTLEQLAGALEMSVEDMLGNLTHTFTAAGEEVTANLSELLSGYQKDADYQKGKGKLAADRRAMEAETAQRAQFFEQSHVVLMNQLGAVEQMVSARLNSAEMEQMRSTNPTEWVAQREEIGEQVRQLQGARQRAVQEYSNARYQMLMDQRQREQKYLTDQKPDFGQKDAQAAREVMESLGYTPDEVNNIFDHRLVLAALEFKSLREELATLRSEKQKATNTAKQVKKEIPKMQKGGKPQRKLSGIKGDNVKRLVQRVGKTGKVADGAAAIEALNIV